MALKSNNLQLVRRFNSRDRTRSKSQCGQVIFIVVPLSAVPFPQRNQLSFQQSRHKFLSLYQIHFYWLCYSFKQPYHSITFICRINKKPVWAYFFFTKKKKNIYLRNFKRQEYFLIARSEFFFLKQHKHSGLKGNLSRSWYVNDGA